MKKSIFITIILLFSSFPLYAGGSTFCKNPDTWEYFKSMTKKYPDNVPLQILHALKIGLCIKLEQNSITEKEATKLFNDMVDSVADMRGNELEQKGKEGF